MATETKCELCGEPMPEGEEMFKYHGYSGTCPKQPMQPDESADKSPKREDYKEWIDWTNALAEWVLNQQHQGKMGIGRLACVFDVVEYAAKHPTPKPKGQWNAEDYRRADDVHTTAERIIKRVVANVLSLAHTRHLLDLIEGDPIDEKEFVADGLLIALGEDTGCLDPDSLSAENCEVLYVEQELRDILERSLKK